jgi:UrcA family protein
MQRSLRTVSTALGAALVALSFSGFASAKDGDPYLKRVEVSYSDLDLGRVSDAQKLYKRIAHAAHNVCGQDFGSITSRTVSVRDECAVEAIGNAVRSVSNENLTAVYLARAGKRAMVASSR